MPRIRQYVAEGVRDAPRLAPVAASDNDTFAAVRQLGQQVMQLGAHYEAVRRKNRLDKAALAASTQLQEFAFGLEHGTLAEDGSFTPPPDPVEHYGLFQAKVRELNDQATAQLGDDELVQAFQQDFSKFALGQSFKVREVSLGRQKEAVLADLDENEDSLAELAAQDDSVVGGAFMENPVREKLTGMYARAVTAGVMGADDAQKRIERFTAKVATAQVRRDLRNDPQLALDGLLGEGYPGLDVDKRERWTSLAVREIERRQREAERANAVTDAAAYTRLRIEAGRGKDVTRDAQMLYEGGRLKKEDFNAILTEIESHRQGGAGGVPTPYKQASDYVWRMTGGDNVVDFGRQQRQAAAMDEYAFWARQHPNATADELDAQARDIVRRSLVVEGNELSMIAPRFAPSRLGGTREGLAEAYRRTEAEFKAGRLTKRERDREMLNIQQWVDYVERQESLAAQPAKPKVK